MIEIYDAYGTLGTKDLADDLCCPDESCREFAGFWCAGGSVYYCDKCEAYRFYDKRFNGHFLIEPGDLIEAYINRHGYYFPYGYVSGSVVEICRGYVVIDNKNNLEKIGFVEIIGVSYPGVGENRFLTK